MGKVLVLAGAVAMGCIPLWAEAAIWYVDGSVSQSGNGQSRETAFKYIYQGITAASDGDTVIVARGTYIGGIRFEGKNIVLRSTDPLDAGVVAGTVIDGNSSGSVVTFSGTETEACVLSGFTIRKGRAYEHGGGILGGTVDNHTHATLCNNVITLNLGNLYGGGVWGCDGLIENNTISVNSAYDGGGLSDCAGTIRNNTIYGNTAEYKGGGLFVCNGTIEGNSIRANAAPQGGGLIHCNGIIRRNSIYQNSGEWGAGVSQCNGRVQNNTILRNSAADTAGGIGGCDGTIQSNVICGNSAGWGGGVAYCHGSILNNTIVRNSASDGGGGMIGCDQLIGNCVLWGNTAPTGAQIHDSAEPTHCCIQDWGGGGEGNTNADPLFADANGADDNFQTCEDNDYRLVSNSPCIDAGDNSLLTSPGLDMDGNLRIARWKYPIVVFVDMGAYEYNSQRFEVTELGFVTFPFPGGRQLTWNSQPNDTYSIWFRYGLHGGEWLNVKTVSSQGEVTSGTATGLLPWDWSTLFYRVEME